MFGKETLRRIKFSTICIILLVTALLLLVYWAVFAPIVTRFLINKEKYVHQGPELYWSGAYLAFEDGESFREVIHYFGIPNENDVVNFYYSDLCVEDNPIYGKQCDVYALDVVLPPDTYQQEKQVVESANVASGVIYDYAIYAFEEEPTVPDRLVMVAFCDQESLVRYIMVTEANPSSFAGFDGYVINHSNMIWTIPQDKDDSVS